MFEWIILALIAIGAGGIAWALMMSLEERSADKRLQALAGGDNIPSQEGFIKGLIDRSKNDRRRKLEEKLREMQGQERKKKKRVTLSQRLQRAGLNATPAQFYLFSLGLGAVLGLLLFVVFFAFLEPQIAMMIGAGGFVIGAIGLPMFLLRVLTQRRLAKFLHHLPDAVELMVRGLRSGLPVTDAMRTIAEEIPDPVGPEFLEVVEGQKVGISMDQGLERMYERVPLAEVNFLSIVIGIQRETGGNLSEALANLAHVLRMRKAMKLKIKAITQEAKVSAFIIGAIPFVLIGAMAFVNPGHLAPLINTTKGNMMAVFSLVWMSLGIMIMYKIINFKY